MYARSADQTSGPVRAIADEDGPRETGLLSDIAHSILDVAGMIPVVGELADGANALFYLAEGNKTDAALSAAAMIPIAGWAATGAKVVRKGMKIAGKAQAIRKVTSKVSRAATALKAAAKRAEKVAKGAEKAVRKVVKALDHKPSWMPDRVIEAIQDKTTTVIGSYGPDTSKIISELKTPKSVDFGPRRGDFNLLNVPDDLYDPATFWDKYNKVWLQTAAERGDEIFVASNPFDVSVTVRNGMPSGFGREIALMNDLVKAGKYKFVKKLGKYIPTK